MFVLTTENHLQAFQRAKHAFTGCHCLQNKQSMQHWRPHCLKPWNMVLEDTHLFKSTSVFPKNLKPEVVYCWLLVVDVVLLYFVLRVRNTTSCIAIEPYSYCFLGYCIVFVTDAMFSLINIVLLLIFWNYDKLSVVWMDERPFLLYIKLIR